jgi:sortase A
MKSVQWALGICALALLGYWGFEKFESFRFQSAQLEELATAAPDAIPEGLIGRIDIPRLDVSVAVMEGSGDSVLKHAAGHIEGTALPGQAGNTGISAHRDTFFRPLRNIRRDDLITVTTPTDSFRYRVVSTRIVLPSNVGVLDSGATQVLTLVTCYPFYFVGSAPNRFIVRAERIL